MSSNRNYPLPHLKHTPVLLMGSIFMIFDFQCLFDFIGFCLSVSFYFDVTFLSFYIEFRFLFYHVLVYSALLWLTHQETLSYFQLVSVCYYNTITVYDKCVRANYLLSIVILSTEPKIVDWYIQFRWSNGQGRDCCYWFV